MRTRFKVRLARVDDVEGIGRVKNAVWPEADLNLERMRQVIAAGKNRTLVADVEGIIAGFVDGFQTVSAQGVRRWELDLIAVHPDFQKRGIAAELMRVSTQYGQEMGVLLARGLVEIGNVGSQRTFARCEYRTDGEIHTLFVLENDRTQAKKDLVEVEYLKFIIPVSTLNYTGLWLEDEWNDDLFRIVSENMTDRKCDLAGSVIPKSHITAHQSARRAGFIPVGQYHWWTLT